MRPYPLRQPASPRPEIKVSRRRRRHRRFQSSVSPPAPACPLALVRPSDIIASEIATAATTATADASDALGKEKLLAAEISASREAVSYLKEKESIVQLQ